MWVFLVSLFGDQNNMSSVSRRYQKLTQLEHLHARPEMYVGGMEIETVKMWIHGMGLVDVDISRGILKVFEEITSNAFDNVSRGHTTKIEVDISPEEFSVKNNGLPIPIVVHEEHNITIPELVFGHFLTGDNYNDNEERQGAGRNGYGAKLTNAFSTEFYVEVVDEAAVKKLRLTYSNNMKDKKLKITCFKGSKSYTKVRAKIDFPKFGLAEATPLLLKAWERRVYDLAACTPSNVSVYLNKEKLPIKGYKDYCQQWGECLYFKINDSVELAVYKEVHEVPPPSFVNGVECNRGSHIQHWVLPLTKKLAELVSKTLKIQVSPSKMAKHVCICGNFVFPNPKFASQTKDVCTTNKREFKHWEWPKSALNKSTGFLKDLALASAMGDARKQMKTKKQRFINIPKLDDARYAGHPTKASQCSLILTEGDSAKGFAVSGFNVVGRDYYGCFPLRGKFLNVKAAAEGKVMKNKEVQNVLRIFGLEIGKEPTKLRYGKCIIMADQDHDGSHIIALLLNLFSHYKSWRKLLDDGFLQIFVTPIIKVKKGRLSRRFFSIDAYNEWKAAETTTGWKTKYYKGLGTSTASEAQECFKDLPTHLVTILPGNECDQYMDLAFNKDRAGDRKNFLVRMPETHPSCQQDTIFRDFVCGRLFEFYHANNHRTIPHMVDGLKPTKRKILYSLLKSQTNEERKVAALAAYVTEKMAYHHGEASLAKTITGMAQNFVGSNNINLLEPEGQFGTRAMGGKDAASPRYIFTKLAPIARKLFPTVDFETHNGFSILEPQEEEGKAIEPVCLAPCLPLLLINGEQGIGVGWSCDWPAYSPSEVCEAVRSWICSENKENFTCTLEPKWRGFTGSVVVDENKVKTYGRIENVVYHGKTKPQEFLIRELPVRIWTMDFRTWLQSQPFVKRVIEESQLENVCIRLLTQEPMSLEDVRKACMPKLCHAMNRIMVCYGADGELKSYESPEQFIKDWCEYRRGLYKKRRHLQIEKVHTEMHVLRREKAYVQTIEELGQCIGKEKEIRETMIQKGYDASIDDLLNIPNGRIMKGVGPIQRKLDALHVEETVLISKSEMDLWLDDLDKLGLRKKRDRDEC